MERNETDKEKELKLQTVSETGFPLVALLYAIQKLRLDKQLAQKCNYVVKAIYKPCIFMHEFHKNNAAEIYN